MKTVIIHGQSHKGSTYHIANILAEKIGYETKEYFLPRDFGELCIGCKSCFFNGEETCPHYNNIKHIADAIDEADVVILASPVYALNVTGAMKSLLDHFAYRFMVHRPQECMFSKQGVCISTAAGAGMGKTNKCMKDSLFYWGIPIVYKIGIGVAATSWDEVNSKKMAKIDRATSSIAGMITARAGRVRVGFKTKFIFGLMRMMNKNGWNPKDKEHWENMGWLGSKRPWN
ncbi:MAG: flavodoxin family protein [Parasporobacterium sp.]|nr:flavodoxin family protein [Parasporobacterium sp.]